MVKSYLRHGPTEVDLIYFFCFKLLIITQAFGLICSAGSNSIYDGKLAFVPALEDVLVWDVRKGQQVSKFTTLLIGHPLKFWQDGYVA